MDNKDQEIENLKKQLESANASFMRYFEECENLKAELLLYKNLIKAQSDIINS